MDARDNKILDDDEMAFDEPAEVRKPSAAPSPRPSPAPQAAKTAAEEALEGASDQRSWYVIHCYSGYENKVRHNLEQRSRIVAMSFCEPRSCIGRLSS